MTVTHFSTATEMRAALAARELSSRELVDLHIARIEAHDEQLNAIPVKTFDRARASADTADRRLGRGEEGPLLGLPMTLKESTLVAGLPQTAGLTAFEGYRPDADGVIARRVFAAGGCLLGKTNIPVALADWQADSPVYGTTNNPWDLARTPGGSTGGGGAALAAGLTPLEIGSDIGGSVRVPAAFCGVYGHRPSETAAPKSGQFPRADLPNPGFLLAVQGPLARSATDLELLFDVIMGPDVGEDIAWGLHLPAARHERIEDFRVAIVPSILDAVPSAAVRARLDELVALLRSAGAKVAEARPEIDLDAYVRDYACLVTSLTSQALPREERETMAAAQRQAGGPRGDAVADGFLLDVPGYLRLLDRREAYRARWRAFFTDWDVVVAPMTLDSAFPHQTGEMASRTLRVDDREIPYGTNVLYPMIAILAGLPSTAFPAGLDPRGLPIGLQAIGPYLEDRTALAFARLIESVWHGFEAPPGY